MDILTNHFECDATGYCCVVSGVVIFWAALLHVFCQFLPRLANICRQFIKQSPFQHRRRNNPESCFLSTLETAWIPIQHSDEPKENEAAFNFWSSRREIISSQTKNWIQCLTIVGLNTRNKCTKFAEINGESSICFHFVCHKFKFSWTFCTFGTINVKDIQWNILEIHEKWF